MVRSIFILILIIKACLGFSDVGKWDLPLSGNSCTFALAKSLFKGSKLYVVLHCGVDEATVSLNYEWTPTLCSPDYFHYYDQEIIECSATSARPIKDLNSTEYSNKFPCHSRISYNMLSGTLLDKKPEDVSYANNFDQPLLTVDTEGVYEFKVTVVGDKKFNVSVEVRLESPYGYLSAAMWPLLVFFGVMCGVYTALCALWLAVCALQWRDLLRIQYCIGGVALLGMLESATFYGVYCSINNTGYFNLSLYMLAEWLSIGKRALARMLVIIVSLGFGIVKPRLGPALQRVLAAGALWFALSGASAWLRLQHRARSNRTLLLSEAPLSLLDSAICWWVFVSLAHTMRTLQLRRNAIKLSLYKHFTNTLVFAVISSVVFMLYSIKSYRVLDCITDWKEVWMDEAYWHMLFCAVLAAIMVLWRPTNNNQRYAFTPLLDNIEDDDEEEQFVNDAYGVKMRGAASADARPAPAPDADLRWVEEHIPVSSLPLLDSDEELINTKFEVSKMQ
ncbi:transmembrane protein 87A [Plodia interpunctella]|uniref:transmembrane protein 87A n=1 Tax=Plodia interpunctella TaxID=58824 RepID=UPI002367F253|nr:transmembrane protein 87A [Plodia interpunctella]